MDSFKSQAEELASVAQDLPSFSNFSLNGVREKVKQILDMIGKIDGIFSTYTKHDITHVEEMLKMLDWLVPPPTKEKMTSVDWLMIVLAIYLHDLGMVVTSEEYERRRENHSFVEFLENLMKDPDEREYIFRADSMPAQDKDKFFYQEFIRKQHPTRIKEWITGKTSYQWGETLKPIAEEISKLMENLPSRFKRNLADICESHHKDDLDNLDKYPLCQHYSSHNNETANVQYSAILLRTADLLHITKDRTPSIMYKIINISDPKGIDAWKKQSGTFSVHMKSYDPENKKSNIIEVSADFDEEEPFFALTEYLAYADEQITQSRNWIEKSQMNKESKDYLFPWQSINRDIKVEGSDPHPMSFDLERGRLLDLLVGHTIYNDPTIAIRELLQNSIDAVRYQYYMEKRSDYYARDDPKLGKVLIKWNPDERELTVEDNGSGMDLEIIESHFMRVGSSFYNTSKFQSEYSDYTPISRFGIGILTCFMISDNIEVITCREEKGYRIRMKNVHAGYLLKELESGDKSLEGLEPHGTRVKLRIRDSIDLEERSILDIVNYWIILPECKVIYSENGKDQEIGVEKLEQILKSFYETENTLADIKVHRYSENGETYELAFAVDKSSLIPGKYFSFEKIDNFPSVCIEGIRVDNYLPGFAVKNNPSSIAILSVRGNKKFRTTVSRENLENDEEYFRVAKICGSLLFKHIEDEVKRTSERQGSPYSQASIIGLSLYNQLKIKSVPKLRDHLNYLCADLPIIVLEKTTYNGAERRAQRELISGKNLNELESYWAIESNLVDYLGNISRNIEREISLNDFLLSMAPDLIDKDVDPLIMEPNLYTDTIFSSHYISKVKLSSDRKQTLIKFNKLQHAEEHFNSHINISPKVMLLLKEYMRHMGYRYSNFVVTPILCSEIESDVEDVRGVRTKMAVILNKDSRAAKLCSSLNIILKNLDLVEYQERNFILEYILKVFFLLTSDITISKDLSTGAKNYISNSGLSGYTNNFSDEKDWNKRNFIINSILEKIGVHEDVYLPVDEILSEGRIVEASSYWNQWNFTNNI